MRVLLVEDEVAVAKLLSIALSRNGFHVEVANDFTTGLELSQALKPDLVVSDIQLQGSSGIDLCHKIRQELPDCKIILMLGAPEFPDLAELAAKNGLNGPVLRKPFSIRTLYSLVRTLCEVA